MKVNQSVSIPKKATNVILSIFIMLPVLLYVVFFWRSGALNSLDQMSAVFQPGFVELDEAQSVVSVVHTNASFGEFVCNTFSIPELNKPIADVIIKAVWYLNESITPHSAYTIYVIAAYFTYIIAIYAVWIVVKFITFIPNVMMKLVDKLSGGGT